MPKSIASGHRPSYQHGAGDQITGALIAEGELQVVHSTPSRAGTDTWSMTLPSFILIRRLQRLARSGA